MSSLSRFFSEHKKALLIGGAVVVAAAAGFALMSAGSAEAEHSETSGDLHEKDTQPVVSRKQQRGNSLPASAGAGSSAAEGAEKKEGDAASSSSASSTGAAGGAGSAKKAGKKGGKKGSAPNISKENMVAMLNEMADRLLAFKNEMEPKVQPIMESGDEAAYQRYQELVTQGLKAIEDEVQTKYGCTQVDAMKAQAAYKDDEDVKAALTKVKMVFFGDDDDEAAASAAAAAGGEGGMDPAMLAALMEAQSANITVPEGMTADKFYSLFDIHLGTVEQGFQRALEEVVANCDASSVGKEQRLQYFQLLIARSMGDWQAEAQEKVGMSEEDFQKCLFKYQKDPRFVTRITQSQEKQMELTAKLLSGGGAEDEEDEEGEESDGENDGVVA